MPLAIGEIIESSFYVEDVAKAVAFYERVFGFRPQMASERMAALAVTPNQVLLLFKKGGSIEPVVFEGGVIPPNDGDGQGHVAFAVRGDDVEGWTSALETQGIAVESRVRWPEGGESLYFRDGDGNLLELKTTAWNGARIRW